MLQHGSAARGSWVLVGRALLGYGPGGWVGGFVWLLVDGFSACVLVDRLEDFNILLPDILRLRALSRHVFHYAELKLLILLRLSC